MNMEYLTIVKDLFVVAAALIASYAAIRGLEIWRSQLKGTTEYQMSTEILEKSYKLQD